MADFLILKLHGVMQAWGGHTFEDFRPSHSFPTRSAVIGFIGACLGIDRREREELADLGASFVFAVRSDAAPTKIVDFHTVLDARKVDGKPNPNPVVSTREYLCDARFTLALQFVEDAPVSMEKVRSAVKKPFFTPYLGRRSCPLTRPIFEAVAHAAGILEALEQSPPHSGTVYSEVEKKGASRLMVRDIPLSAGKRQFANRSVYIIPT